MTTIFMLLIVLCGTCIVATIVATASISVVACDSKLTPIVILCGIMFSIIYGIRSFYLYELKSNTRYRYEQLTGEKPACKKPTINENHIAKNNEVVFNIVEVNNKYVAKLTFHDTMIMNRFFDYEHKCSDKECASNYRKYVQDCLNRYNIKQLVITWPRGSYTKVSTNLVKLPEISIH